MQTCLDFLISIAFHLEQVSIRQNKAQSGQMTSAKKEDLL